MSYVSQRMMDDLKDHVLEEFSAGEKIRAFYLRHPDRKKYGRLESTLLLFTPEGIVLMGDMCPGGPRNQGSISDRGCTPEWFAALSQDDQSYLCARFLAKEWQSKHAIQWVKEQIRLGRTGEFDGYFEAAAHRERMAQTTLPETSRESMARKRRNDLLRGYVSIIRRLDEGDIFDSTMFVLAMQEINRDFDPSDHLPGFDYPEREAAVLCAIQRKFAELFKAKKEAVPVGG